MKDSVPQGLRLVLVEPQPTYIESSGRWKWPLSPPHDNDGKCPHVYTASREWWEYVPDGAKPHPWAEGVRLRDDHWYWAIPDIPEVPQLVPCTACTGGRFIVECCNGSSGCSCGGEPVDMGLCRVCGGSGQRSMDADVRANIRQIQGLCYIGSGPRY